MIVYLQKIKGEDIDLNTISDEALHMILGSVSYTSFRYLSSVGGLDINPNWDKVVAQPYHPSV
jgi:hypothetical protein